MSEKSEKFSSKLDELIHMGDNLFQSIQYECRPEEYKKEVLRILGKEKFNDHINKLPSFNEEYQTWFSEAQALVKQVMPDRLTDFNSHYESPRVRKIISYQNYMIRDFLQGLTIRNSIGEVIVGGSAAIPEFRQQLNIVRAAKKNLDSALMDISGIMQADLFDSEVDSARALAKAGHLRAAGAVCGVVIEKHLLQVCQNHSIRITKKNPSISDLNQALKDNGNVDVPQWRFVQHLADIRNLCDHAKEKEPTKEQIDDLVAGTDKVLKTVF